MGAGAIAAPAPFLNQYEYGVCQMENKTRSGIQTLPGILLIILCLLLGILVYQFTKTSKEPQEISPQKKAIEKAVLAKWSKPLSALPTENLIIVSPHNEAIREKFEKAFVRYYAVEKGKRLLVWWNHPGGSNAIMDFLLSEKQKDKPLPLDVVFGGGEYLFEQLAEKDMLTPLTIDQETLDQIPAEFAGVRLYDPQLRWCGNVLGGFGFLYDRQNIQSTGLNELSTWQDLARPELMGQIAVANPKNSGSTVVAFEMILQSELDWPSGWKTLMGILSNAKEFMSSSDDAANAPLFDQAAAAICIDFYGMGREALEPEKLAYVNPQGQTAFTPDPIAVLQDAPNKEIAVDFVNFVLSPQGQALWGTRSDDEKRISVNALYRTPIRKDFYSSSVEGGRKNNPYELAQTVQIDSELRLVRYGVLRQLVRAAAVENFELMKQAKQKIDSPDADSAEQDAFYRLPDNIDTLDEIRLVSDQLADADKADQILTDWVEFFNKQYQTILN